MAHSISLARHFVKHVICTFYNPERLVKTTRTAPGIAGQKLSSAPRRKGGETQASSLSYLFRSALLCPSGFALMTVWLYESGVADGLFIPSMLSKKPWLVHH